MTFKKHICIALSGITAAVCLAQINPALAIDNRIDQIRPDAPELAAYGRYPVGVTTLQVSNPGQLDILNAKPDEAIPRYNRPLTLEIWYPAVAADHSPSATTFRTFLRDGKTEVTLTGKAVRDAAAEKNAGVFPLVIVSHGYPGNRFLLSHLTENLASKGYVVVAIDHTDSTFHEFKNFSSTLLNRSLDQLFVLNQMALLNEQDNTGKLTGIIDAANTALIGYSMGGYGVLNSLGAGVSAKSVSAPTVPNGALQSRAANDPRYLASIDKRIKAAVAFAPWGWNAGLWDTQALAAIKTPLFYIAGSADDVSGYSPGVRNLFESSINTGRYLLTFENANHSAGAPIPAPKESWQAVPTLKRIPAESYIDAVWDNTRMNNVSQHFVTAFLGKYLKHDDSMDAFLALTENAKDGKWSTDESGNKKPDHTYWKGFPARTAVGLKLEYLPAATSQKQ
ncbi:alpha/beta hydrolase family protein [Undibacterium aquatile]|uniref:Dienelactone hydrolase n=1 Tax=Undibacterium aquatile TaxID=1537398 RepID=A0ABR6XJ74_9BURK|nr:dienelactone hydrolase [Undibacterium aquatile]MBC3812959.1 dienelactone hydrolase [Undibacterium aquatile]